MIRHVVLCLAEQRERMAFQNLSSNSYIVVQWRSNIICEITSVDISQKKNCNGIATPLHDNIGV